MVDPGLQLATLLHLIQKANDKHLPAGTPGGKGGQFAPKQGGSWLDQMANMYGLTPSKPPPGAEPHPKTDDKGQPVTINYPSKASDPSTWTDPQATATFVPGGAVPTQLHGVAFQPWQPPKDNLGWATVLGQNASIVDAPLVATNEKDHLSTGVIIVEPDGRVWLTSPTNRYGGYHQTWPKGTLEPGLTLQANAIKEAWEETGLKVNIVGSLGDVQRDTSVARMYVAVRAGGTPAAMGWESQAVKLAPMADVHKLLNRTHDKAIATKLEGVLRGAKVIKAADDIEKSSKDSLLAKINAAKLAPSNVNAPYHNAKLDQIAGHLSSGNHNAMLGLGFGSNNYAKAQVKLANEALGHMGSAHQVAIKTKAGAHPALASSNPAGSGGVPSMMDSGSLKKPDDAFHGNAADDPAFEAKHPRDADGKFAPKGTPTPANLPKPPQDYHWFNHAYSLAQKGDTAGLAALEPNYKTGALKTQFGDYKQSLMASMEHGAKGAPLSSGNATHDALDAVPIPPMKAASPQMASQFMLAAAKSGDAGAITNAQAAARDAAASSAVSHEWKSVNDYGDKLKATMTQGVKVEAQAARLSGTPSINDWTQVGAKPGGSNPGGLFKDKDGTLWLVKGNVKQETLEVTHGVSDDRAHNEVLASKLMAAAGAPAPEIKLVNLGGKFGSTTEGPGQLGVAVKMIDDVKPWMPTKSNVAAVQAQFATHAWLGNYDVMGTGNDNMMSSPTHGLINIDPGGALLFRAQGLPKPSFGSDVKEWDSMRNPKINAYAGKVFGPMTESQLAASAMNVGAVPNATILDLVKTHGPGDAAAKKTLAETLMNRRDDIMDKANPAALDPSFEGKHPRGADGKFTAGTPEQNAYSAKTAAAMSLAAKTGTHQDVSVAYTSSFSVENNPNGVEPKQLFGAGNIVPLNQHYQALYDAKKAEGLPNTPGILGPSTNVAGKEDAPQVRAPKEPAGVLQAAPSAEEAPVAKVVPGMPDFDAKKLALTNTNAASVNAKYDKLKSLAQAGDTKGLLALSYGTNNYAKAQVKTANEALAALGSPYQVTPGQKTGTHPALSLTGGAATTANAPTSGTSKLVSVPDSALPTPPDFANFKGPGQGLSSKPHVNESNQAAVEYVKQLAKNGDVNALKGATFKEINKETGALTGKTLPMSEHPSKYVQNYFSGSVDAVNEIVNPPKPLVFGSTFMAQDWQSLAREATPVPLMTPSTKIKDDHKFGFWFALGHSSFNDSNVKPVSLSAAQVSAGKKAYQSYSPTTKTFVANVQSGGILSAFKNADASYGGQNLKALASSAIKDATPLPQGTTTYRWQSMTKTMSEQLKTLQPGAVLQGSSPMPTSYDPMATKGFGNNLFRFHAGPGAKVIHSHGSGGFKTEKEVTLLPYQRFVMLKKQHNGTHWTVDLLLLPPTKA